MASQVKDAAWLDWIAGLMGVGSRETETASLPPEQFSCLLDELPLHLIPRGRVGVRNSQVRPAQLFFNPRCSILPAGQLPPELETHRDLLINFNLQHTIAWVRDAGSGSLHPFWLGPRLESFVSCFRAREPVPGFLPPRVRSLLMDAGIAIPEGDGERGGAEWASTVRLGSQQFRERGYAPIRELIHPFNLAALRRYYRYAIRHGNIRLGDEHVPLRYVAHNESVARFFHYQMGKAVAAIAGEPVKPSYVYFSSYKSGAELKKHTDRQQCEFSVTLCLDFSPEPELQTPWPICLDTPEGSVSVYQALGDGLVYRGTRLPHYRAQLGAGYTSSSIFFHYVPADFDGPLE